MSSGSGLDDGRDFQRIKTFTRRTAMISGGTMILFTGLLGRMYQLQVLESDQYLVLAEDNRINMQLLPPLRGRILDRFGTELATNRQNFRVIMVPEETASVETALVRLANYVPISDSQRERIFREVKRNKRFVPVMVAENLTWEQFAAINLHAPALEGLQPDVGETRFYPYSDKLSHIIGYVAAVSDRDLGENDPLLHLPGFRIGRQGIERAVDKPLRGRAGARRIEVNAAGRVIRELSRSPGEQGDDVVLSLDWEVQKFAQARVADQSAACCVMDIHNGDVIALVSNPGFDPNAFNVGLNQTQWQALLNDPMKPLINKAIAGQYPPGSTFKPVVALAALENNVISPETTVVCTGKTSLGSHDFHCWKRGGHGAMNMLNGIKQSCDVYFYELARRLGIDRIAEMARKFGFGETHDFEVPGEKAGLVPSRGWKLATSGVEWQQGETLITGIGQGYLLTTPLQLCTMAARLGNGGHAVKPRMIRSVGAEGYGKAEAPSLGIADRSLQLVCAGLDAVTNAAGGTAFGSRITEEEFMMAGKTGTAQVRRITREERMVGIRSNDSLPWELRDHALFIAFAPVQAPRYAISVIVEHGGGGSKAAAPVARDIMLMTLQRDTLRMKPIAPVVRPPRPATQGA